jgi:hypothetical protein
MFAAAYRRLARGEMIFSEISSVPRHRIGLVNHVYEDSQLQEQALAATRLPRRPRPLSRSPKWAESGPRRDLAGELCGIMQSICMSMKIVSGDQGLKEKREPFIDK